MLESCVRAGHAVIARWRDFYSSHTPEDSFQLHDDNSLGMTARPVAASAFCDAPECDDPLTDPTEDCSLPALVDQVHQAFAPAVKATLISATIRRGDAQLLKTLPQARRNWLRLKPATS